MTLSQGLIDYMSARNFVCGNRRKGAAAVEELARSDDPLLFELLGALARAELSSSSMGGLMESDADLRALARSDAALDAMALSPYVLSLVSASPAAMATVAAGERFGRTVLEEHVAPRFAAMPLAELSRLSPFAAACPSGFAPLVGAERAVLQRLGSGPSKDDRRAVVVGVGHDAGPGGERLGLTMQLANLLPKPYPLACAIPPGVSLEGAPEGQGLEGRFSEDMAAFEGLGAFLAALRPAAKAYAGPGGRDAQVASSRLWCPAASEVVAPGGEGWRDEFHEEGATYAYWAERSKEARALRTVASQADQQTWHLRSGCMDDGGAPCWAYVGHDGALGRYRVANTGTRYVAPCFCI